MKTFSSILFFVLLALPISAQVLFVGHRGCNLGVENTETAYRNAVSYYHYAGLECDVKATGDGQLVCCHDNDLTRLGHDSLLLSDYNLAELQELTLSQKRGDSTYTATICTVDRYLAICAELNVFPIVELKWTDGINNNDMSRFPELYALIEKHHLVSQAVILTSMKNSLEYVRANFPALQCQYLCYELTEERIEWCKQWNLHPSVRRGGLTPEAIAQCHAAGLKVAVWCVNTEADYLLYKQMGCDIMTCDYLITDNLPE